MAKPMQSTGSRVVAVILVVCGIAGFVGWRLIHPAMSHVSMAQIRAVLPPEVLETMPEDLDAEKRLDALLGLVKGIDTKTIEGFMPTAATSFASPRPGTPAKHVPTEHERYLLAVKFWQDRPQLENQLKSLVQAGPVQSRLTRTDFAGDSNVKSVAKALAASAVLYAKRSDFAASARMLTIATHLADGVLAGDGTFMDYLVGVAIQAIVMRGIREATDVAGYPVSDLQQLLQTLSPAPKTDTSLRVVLRAEFQKYVLPALPDQNRVWQELAQSGSMDDEDAASKDPIGTYDAVETATLYGKCEAIQMRNALLPLSLADPTAQNIQDQAAKGLPEAVDESKLDEGEKSIAKFKYRVKMNTTHNSLGRLLISEIMLGGKSSVVISCRQRATRDATRVLLASKLYRASHGGKLPMDKSGLIPLLGAWPQDPFNGKELIYDAKTEKVYSVGENLIDDHGDVAVGHGRLPLDLGLSLKVGE